MKIIKTSTLIPLSISVLAIAIASASWAAGTAAGTSIANTATINYEVGGTAQTKIESSGTGNSTPGNGAGTATTFKVDKKIDLTVTATSGNVATVPGKNDQAITFTLTNDGNSTEDFSFAVSKALSGDNFDPTSCDTPSSVNLVADGEATITVLCDMPASGGAIVNAATSKIGLTATVVGAAAAAAATSSGADDAAVVETVLADSAGAAAGDGDGDASHSAINTYTIHTADLTVKKVSTVTKMKINNSDVAANAKRIPGATIEYTITVVNAATAATATGIIITDDVPADLTVVGTPTISGGTSTNASATGNAVSTTPFDLAAGQTATLTIIATVN